MKKFTVCVALSVVTAQAALINAQVATNRIRLAPTNNIAAARSRYPLGDFGRIATNTPAFEEYGLNFMLAQANEIREKWKLDIPKPLTVTDVLFQLKATAFGLDGGLGTRDKRFNWAFSRNALDLFEDHKYSPRSFRHHDDESARLTKIKSRITTKEAEAIAQDSLHKLGLTEKQLRLKEPPAVNQYTFEESDGTIYPLPMFNVTWIVEGFEEDVPLTVDMQVSGITKKVAKYFNADPHTPRVSMPTNYFQMLGLPTNYLETLPEKQRLKLGLLPLTNSPALSTNSIK